MVFKRRDQRPWGRLLSEAVYPRGGWSRAISYLKHRILRLPDSPQSIARGFAAGIFISFTPLFGLHFFGGALFGWIVRGNVVAALLATFVVNPITLPLVAFLSFSTGNILLGRGGQTNNHGTLMAAFVDAWVELKANFFATFSDAVTHWDNLSVFFGDVFLPYLIGGIVAGTIAGAVFYAFISPLVSVYQHRRKKRLRDRFEDIKARLKLRGRTENP